jgi:hypothetical protein
VSLRRNVKRTAMQCMVPLLHFTWKRGWHRQSLSSVHEQCHQRSVQGGVYLLTCIHSPSKYHYILYRPHSLADVKLVLGIYLKT